MYYIRRLLYVYTAVLLCTVQLDGGCIRLLLLVFMVNLTVTLDGYPWGGVIGGARCSGALIGRDKLIGGDSRCGDEGCASEVSWRSGETQRLVFASGVGP